MMNFFLLAFFFFFFLTTLKKIWPEWVYFLLNQTLRVFWKLSKWENKPFYPAWVRCSKHKIKIAPWEAADCFALSPGWLTLPRAHRPVSGRLWFLLDLVLAFISHVLVMTRVKLWMIVELSWGWSKCQSAPSKASACAFSMKGSSFALHSLYS